MVKNVTAFLWAMFAACTIPLASGQNQKEKWVDSVFNSMKLNEKIGQLFMISLSSQAGDHTLDDIERQVESYHVGGIHFTTGDPVKQVTLTNRFQSRANVPLFIAQDVTSGTGTLLDSLIRFPHPLVQGAIANDSLVYAMGVLTGRQMKTMGIHIGFGPNANIISDASYPISSFGEDGNNVTAKAISFMKGLQEEGILPCARYFPIKSITVVNFQKGLPVVQFYEDSAQVYPFVKLFEHGLPAVMPAVSELPIFFKKRKTAHKNQFSGAVLSSAFAGKWIENQLNFDGLIVLDIQSLTTVSGKFEPGDAEVFAFQAGNDILLTHENIGPAVRKIRKLVRTQKQYAARLNESVKKILAAKYDAGLHSLRKPEAENLLAKLDLPAARILQEKMYEASITVVRNAEKTLPVQVLENKRFTSVTVGEAPLSNDFHKWFGKYIQTHPIHFTDDSDPLQVAGVLQHHDVIAAAIFPSASEALVRRIFDLLEVLSPAQEVIICDFGNPFARSLSNNFSTVLTAYTDAPEAVRLLPQVIFGAVPAQGVTPVTFGDDPPGTSEKTHELHRLAYSFPEAVAMDSRTLQKIEEIAREAIDMQATPGCHVLVARNGKVIYEKSFGHLTYEKVTPVTDDILYDLASVTKVAATLQAVMFMHDRKLIDIHKKASVYLPELKNSNKKDHTLKDILTHQAGLWPYLPFWLQTMKDSLHLPEFYSPSPTLEYPYLVADRLFASASMRDSLWHWVIQAKVREKTPRIPYDYRYSDMGFYILQHLAEKILNQPMEDFLSQNLYEPLGASTTGYLPLLRFPIRQIAPTENDLSFRKALLIGTVHDQGAAMHGGVAGHAGLFSNANDLAKLAQMLLQGGHYGGYRYYNPETIELFTRQQYHSSRRGLGWDKPVLNEWNSPTSRFASKATYGHTGFTGTCMWVDPEFQLVYIFLSNRVHPDMNNRKLLDANIRSRIQDIVYESIFNYCKRAGNGPLSEEPYKIAKIEKKQPSVK